MGRRSQDNDNWAITAPGGQKLALNDTGDAVFVWYKDHGVQKLMAVGLAASRSCIAWMSDGYSEAWDISSLPNLSFSGQVTANMTDAEIDALSGSASNTAKRNTDMIVQSALSDPGSAAAVYCRSRRIAGHACSLPNMNQLRRIYALRYVIDSLDPAASGKTTYKLSNWGFRANGAAGLRCWASDECDGSSAWSVESSGLANPHDKLVALGVIPILELDPVTLRTL